MFEQIKKQIVGFFDKNSSHDLDHTMRVYNMCIYIGKKEWADLEILEIASLMHDIWRPKQHETKGRICHAEYWAILTKKILEDLWLEKEKIDHVVDCISTHRFRKWNNPETLEAKILFDADKLDSIWAVWIWRAFMYANEVGARLHNDKDTNLENTKEHSSEDTAFREYMFKLIKVKNKLFTQTAKNMAKKKHKTMVRFFDSLNEETWETKELFEK